jgi:hypothetical protein
MYVVARSLSLPRLSGINGKSEKFSTKQKMSEEYRHIRNELKSFSAVVASNVD